MTPPKVTSGALYNNMFVQRVLAAARRILGDIGLRDGKPIPKSQQRLPDEHEFFILRVGNKLARLVSCCRQLEYGVVFLSTYRVTDVSKRAGVTRSIYLAYNIESYIIRTQTLSDLALQLVDAVFHLANSDKQCRSETILKNLKVSRTDVPKVFKKIQAHLQQFAESRHQIVHRGSFKDEELERLELFTLLEEDAQRRGRPLEGRLQGVSNLRKQHARDLLRNRAMEYQDFNATSIALVDELFDTLSKDFESQNEFLARALGKPAS